MEQKKLFHCEDCTKSYTTRSNLNFHIKRIHPEKTSALNLKAIRDENDSIKCVKDTGYKKAEKQFIAECIEVYRGLPALWDVKSKDYSNRAKKREQYDVLIGKYREKFPDADIQEVVKKINSLRTNFRKELKRIRDAEKSGTGAGGVEPSLWYFDEMRFLQTQETPTGSIGTTDISQNNIVVANNESRQTNRRRKSPDTTDKLASQRLQEPQDDSDKIAAAWAVELRKMDPQQQLFAKKAISDILFEGQMGTLHRNSVEINSSRVSTS
ncbi:hypothetical protein GWI33_017933 [Rhynchophorus ferrugineus]|uniref:MADF domain-containing protein n=1 Tax=Rhynchophorus ferrugineus TaxID=354439 RepID=A0A834HUH8_RHYFE|nr:hypothetical protein GWI33_017933 [Rhynchophorus ferrugineus]